MLEPPDAALLGDCFRVPVVERTDQTNIILRLTLTVPRSIRAGCLTVLGVEAVGVLEIAGVGCNPI